MPQILVVPFIEKVHLGQNDNFPWEIAVLARICCNTFSMKNSERDELKKEWATLTDLLQGMLGFLTMTNSSYEMRINQVLANNVNELDWQVFEETTTEARDIQIEANNVISRIWQIELTLMNNPNIKEIYKGGGLILIKMRGKQISQASELDRANNQGALDEWNERIHKVGELRRIWDKN